MPICPYVTDIVVDFSYHSVIHDTTEESVRSVERSRPATKKVTVFC